MYTCLSPGWLTAINLHAAARSICPRVAVKPFLYTFIFACICLLHTHTYTRVMFQTFEIIKPVRSLVSHSTRRKLLETRRQYLRINQSQGFPKFPYSRAPEAEPRARAQIFNLASANMAASGVALEADREPNGSWFTSWIARFIHLRFHVSAGPLPSGSQGHAPGADYRLPPETPPISTTSRHLLLPDSPAAEIKQRAGRTR